MRRPIIAKHNILFGDPYAYVEAQLTTAVTNKILNNMQEQYYVCNTLSLLIQLFYR